MSAETLKLYSAKLSEYPPEDVRAVCAEIADTPRREGETAFPERGKIVSRLEQIAAERSRERYSEAQQAKTEAWFWQWVTEQVEDTGKPEQEVLDSVKVSGFTGRKARNGA